VTKQMLNQRFDTQKYIAPVVAHLDIDLVQVACGEEHVIMLDIDGKLFG
jgi:alpha-tubulin suppressor-like RCC1 family protein